MGIVEEWLDQFSNEYTSKNYRSSINKFRHFIEDNLDSYLENLNGEKLLEDLRHYYRSMGDEDLASKSKNNHARIAKLFFEEHGVRIEEDEWKKFNRREMEKDRPETQDTQGTHDQWGEILKKTTKPYTSAYLLTLLSTGMRSREALKVKKGALDLEEDPAKIHVRAEWTKNKSSDRTVFLTTEAEEEIKKYLDWAEGRVKKNGEEFFPDDQDRNVQLLFPLSHEQMRYNLNRALEKAGLDETDSETGRKKIHLHSCRKFFRTYAGLGEALTKAIMGQYGYLDSSYLRSDPERAAKEFKKKAESNLTIFGERKTEEMRRRAVIDAMEAMNPEITDEQKAEALEIAGMDSISSGTPDQFKTYTKELGKSRKEPTQKVVSEEKVEDYLAEGWRFVDKLNDDQAVVESR